MTSVRAITLSPGGRRAVRLVLMLGAVVGLLIGLSTLRLHLGMDPLADVHAYYDAGARLNAGQSLYDGAASDSVGLYLYPPLLAVLFRPLALLPFHAAAVVWLAIIVAAFALALLRIGIREHVLLALGALAMPILWTLSIGQAEPLVTLLLTIGSPAAIAIAGHLKLVPWLAAAYWVGRRDMREVARFAAWVIAVGLLQFVLEPAGTLAYLELSWLRPAFEVRNISPFAIHPLLWLAVVVVLTTLALRYARTRAGWPLAVALTVFVYPRLLAYQLSSLLAAFGGPRPRERSG